MRAPKPPGPAIRLPLGVRDYLPAAAAERRAVAEACLGAFERWGYRRIITPVYEYADVLARGSDTPAIRFVEPVSGEVVALRTDITPQVARLYATRLHAAPGPARLCYEGSVLRLAHARGQRELTQAGVELFDAPQAEGDAEVIALAAEALAGSGIDDLTIDLGHMGFLRAALRNLPTELREALARKDARRVERLAAAAGLPAERRKLVSALPRLRGEPQAVLREARRLAGGLLRQALDELAQALYELKAHDVGAAITIDLGEVRGFDYYTGVRFAGFAAGCGDALLTGGRYDDLCGRYGHSARATGFAVDVEAVAGALEVRGAPGQQSAPSPRGGVLVAGPRPLAPRIAAGLRRRGQRAACDPNPDASERALRAQAAHWGYARVLLVTPRGASFLDPSGERSKMAPAEFQELKQ